MIEEERGENLEIVTGVYADLTVNRRELLDGI